MTTFVFRNHTVEAFFGYDGVTYSGYDDISSVPGDVDRYIWFFQVPVNADSAQLVQEIDSYCDQLDLVIASVNETKPFIVFSLENLFPLRLTGNETSVSDSVNRFNHHVIELAKSPQNIKWVDFSEFTSRYNAETLVNWKYYHMSQTLLNPKLAHDFHAWWQQINSQLDLQRKKCLVLDLDNTLWGGVLGEDGIDGIKLGGDYPGNAFFYWQRSLLQLAKNGVILAICSKNNENDVIQAWQLNPNMVLKREHFAAVRINWNDKATNLSELADELNIGLDSMVFVDDNPTERELIKQMLPQVEVPDFPEKPYQLMPFFKQLTERFFRIYAVTNEDLVKTRQYQENAMRHAERSRFADLESYLYSLDIAIDVIPVDEHRVPRVAQMTQKTNQFNLTTRRYTESDVRQLMEQGWHLFCMNESDRFGDNGVTGTIFLEPLDDVTVNIDTLLLSCRILGKGVEDAFVKTVLNLLRLDGYRHVKAQYLPTAKNMQTADFYDRLGMACIKTSPDGVKDYEMDLKQVFEIKNCYNIRVL